MPTVHLLTPPLGDLRTVSVVCRATMPELGSWDRHAVTCPQCLEPSRRRRPRALPGDMEEKDLQELVRQACGVGHWLYMHVHDSRHSPSGFPDMLALRQGRLIAAELKRAGQEPTPAQTRWLEAFRQVDVLETYVWRPGDLDQVLEVLR